MYSLFRIERLSDSNPESFRSLLFSIENWLIIETTEWFQFIETFSTVSVFISFNFSFSTRSLSSPWWISSNYCRKIKSKNKEMANKKSVVTFECFVVVLILFLELFEWLVNFLSLLLVIWIFDGHDLFVQIFHGICYNFDSLCFQRSILALVPLQLILLSEIFRKSIHFILHKKKL